MKDKVRFISLVVFAFALVSCAITPNVRATFDESLPEDKTTSIIFMAADFKWTSYNGIPVEWPRGGMLSYDEIKLPAGETTLIFDLTYSRSDGYSRWSTTGKDLELRYNFEAKKRYLVFYPSSESKEAVDIMIMEPGEKVKSEVLKRKHDSVIITGSRGNDGRARVFE